MGGETLAVRGQSIVWERKLEFIGSVIEPGAHSGGAVRHRSHKASSVFCKWKPLLCNPNLSLKERVKAFDASTLSSATCLSGCSTLSKQTAGFKRDRRDDSATFWRKLHRREHELAEACAVSPVDMYLRALHSLAGHFARFENDKPVQKPGVVAPETTRMEQDQVWRCSPATV